MTIHQAQTFGFAAVVLLILCVAGCNTPGEILAHCQRWSNKWVGIGAHANPAAYHNDLMITCMALKETPYEQQAQRQQQQLVAADADWSNPSVSQQEFTKIFGRDKAGCIERAYVGQSSQGTTQSQVGGSGFGYGNVFGAGMSGSQSGSYNSVPVFNEELFVACMNAAGWELAQPTQ